MTESSVHVHATGKCLLAVSALLPLSVFAGPTISDVAFSQSANRDVTITYKLSGEPAVVTMDIFTNCAAGAGASIGGRNLWLAQGDVNRLVGKGFDFSNGAAKDCSISWTPGGTDIGESGFMADPESVKALVKAWPTNSPPDYMVVSLDAPAYAAADTGARAEYYPAAEFVPGGVTENPVYKETKVVMRKIHAAGVVWRMGSTEAIDGTDRVAADEIPHLVELTYDYYFGVFPITQAQYVQVMGGNPASFTNAADHLWRPIESVGVQKIRGTWTSPISERPGTDSVLDIMSKATGVSFDLPKDAEWEYACRAGSGGKRGRGTSGHDMTDAEVLKTASYRNGETTVVGVMAPNAWGIYDLYGNVWEFCLDYRLSGSDLYKTFGGKGLAEPVVDPFVNTGSTTAQHVDRGPSYTGALKTFRPAYRSYYNYSYGGGATAQGFRVRAPAVAE